MKFPDFKIPNSLVIDKSYKPLGASLGNFNQIFQNDQSIASTKPVS